MRAMDFMWHKLAITTRFWVLNAVEEYTRWTPHKSLGEELSPLQLHT